MNIIISTVSNQPIYEQIVVQIKAMIMSNALKPGDPLPSIRKLARDLHVSVITTQRVYDELVKDGFVDMIPAKGAFVSNTNTLVIQNENKRRIQSLIDQIKDIATTNDIAVDTIKEMIDSTFKEN